METVTIKRYEVNEKKPRCPKNEHEGTPVLVWFGDDSCPDDRTDHGIAYYGRRQTAEPNFYIYGRVISPSHWSYLPAGPKVVPKRRGRD